MTDLATLQHRDYLEKARAAGFHVAGIDVGPSWPARPRRMSARSSTNTWSLSTACTSGGIMGQSHGGLIAYGWAFRHPTCVDRIAGICPATDFRSWPTLPNVDPFPAKGLDYGSFARGAQHRRSREFNPIDNLAPLAKRT